MEFLANFTPNIMENHGNFFQVLANNPVLSNFITSKLPVNSQACFPFHPVKGMKLTRLLVE